MKRTLSIDANKLLIIQTLFFLSIGLSGLFVNVYLWKLTANMTEIAWYNIWSYTAVLAVSLMSGWIARKKSITFCLRMGLLGFVIYYLSILLLNEKAVHYLVFLGFLSGFGTGCFYYAQNTLVYYVTNQVNRGYYLGISGALAAFTGIVSPIVSGWIISSNQALTGYHFVFLLTFLLFVIAGAISYRAKDFQLQREYHLSSILAFKDKHTWRMILVGNFFIGFQDGAVAFIINILLYLVFQSEMSLGNFTTFISLLTVLSSYGIGKYITKANQELIFLAGAIFTIMATGVLITWTNYSGVIIYGLLIAIFKCWWNIPFMTINYEVIEKTIHPPEQFGDYMIVREIPLNLGRIAGIILFIIMNQFFINEEAIKILLAFLSLMILLVYGYFRFFSERKHNGTSIF
ncbi:MFS transporter [Bacillus songklensis]|uniref:MFS transporter n=1 Tax=Bacillus songklensis TaxID=1069116 RepID=A0ABV8AWJ8_9BACI